MRERQQSLYLRILGRQFSALAPELQQLHSLTGRTTLHGHYTVKPARLQLLRWCSALLRLPSRAASAPFQFELQVRDGVEVWLRYFQGHTLRSELSERNGRLVEKMGFVRFVFELLVEQGKLSMQLTSMSVAGIPLPRVLWPQVWGREHGAAGRFYFDAGASWGWLGLIVAYSGWLEVGECR